MNFHRLHRIASLPLLAALMVAVTGGCLLPHSPVTGRGGIAVSSDGVKARTTILPTNIAASISDYLITFTGPEVADAAIISKADYLASGYTRGGLAVGTWTVTVQGRNGSSNVIAQGSATGVVVTQNGTTPVSITLDAVMTSGADGTVDLTLDWNTTGIDAITGIDGSISFEAGTTVPIQFVLSGRTARYMAILTVGSYFIEANLMAGSNLMAPFSEAVQVYDGLSTTATITLGTADFNGPPSAPTGLTAIGGADAGFINLSWADTSKVETSFTLERKATEDPSFAILSGTIRASTVSYKDLSALYGVTYTYRIKASNLFGASAYSSEASDSWTRSTGSKALTSFSFAHPGLVDQTATINETDGLIEAQLPWAYRHFPLIVEFAATGESVSVSGTPQTSGVTAVDFAQAVTYTVTAVDTTTKNYAVNITFSPTPISVPGTTSYFSGPEAGGIGTKDGIGTAAQFFSPRGLWDDGTYVYVADAKNHSIRRIDKVSQEVSTLAGLPGYSGSADGTGSSARFGEPSAMTGLGACLYVVDMNGIRKINASTGEVTTIFALACLALNWGSGITTDGTDLYLAQRNFSTTPSPFYGIRRIGTDGTLIANIAGSSTQWSSTDGTGDGTGSAARFFLPTAIQYMEMEGGHKVFYVGDRFALRKIVTDGADGVVTTVAGAINTQAFTDGIGAAARFSQIVGQMFKDGTDLYLIDNDNRAIRRVSLTDYSTATFFRDGSGGFAPGGLAWDGSRLLVSDRGNADSGHVIKSLNSLAGTNLGTASLADFAGAFAQYGLVDGSATNARFREPWGMASDGEFLYVADNWQGAIRKVSMADGSVSTLAQGGDIVSPRALCFDGSDLYALTFGTNRKIARVSLSGIVTVVADLGIYSTNGLSDSRGIACDNEYFYIAADQNHKILRVSRADTTQVQTLAGSGTSGSSDGVGTSAQFNYPMSLTRDGAYLYVADRMNKAVRKVEIATGTVSTVYRETASTDYFYPWQIAIGADSLYVLSSERSDVYVVPKSGGSKTLIAGWPTSGPQIMGSTDGTGDAARFNSPQGIWYDGNRLYITDTNNHRIRVLE